MLLEAAMNSHGGEKPEKQQQQGAVQVIPHCGISPPFLRRSSGGGQQEGRKLSTRAGSRGGSTVLRNFDWIFWNYGLHRGALWGFRLLEGALLFYFLLVLLVLPDSFKWKELQGNCDFMASELERELSFLGLQAVHLKDRMEKVLSSENELSLKSIQQRFFDLGNATLHSNYGNLRSTAILAVMSKGEASSFQERWQEEDVDLATCSPVNSICSMGEKERRSGCIAGEERMYISEEEGMTGCGQVILRLFSGRASGGKDDADCRACDIFQDSGWPIIASIFEQKNFSTVLFCPLSNYRGEMYSMSTFELPSWEKKAALEGSCKDKRAALFLLEFDFLSIVQKTLIPFARKFGMSFWMYSREGLESTYPILWSVDSVSISSDSEGAAYGRNRAGGGGGGHAFPREEGESKSSIPKKKRAVKKGIASSAFGTLSDSSWAVDLGMEVRCSWSSTLSTFSFSLRHPVWIAIVLILALVLGGLLGSNGRRIEILERLYGRMKAVNGELLTAKLAAEAAASCKSQFLATISHEIRTPLNGVLGMLSLLHETNLDPMQIDYVQTAESSGRALMVLINDVLDFSKIEAGKMEMEHIPFDLRADLDDVVGMFGERVRAKGVELASIVQPAVPQIIVGDPGRFRQVLVNLIGNAIKFTESGHILITIRVAAFEEDFQSIHSQPCTVRVSKNGSVENIRSAVKHGSFMERADDDLASSRGGREVVKSSSTGSDRSPQSENRVEFPYGMKSLVAETGSEKGSSSETGTKKASMLESFVPMVLRTYSFNRPAGEAWGGARKGGGIYEDDELSEEGEGEEEEEEGREGGEEDERVWDTLSGFKTASGAHSFGNLLGWLKYGGGEDMEEEVEGVVEEEEEEEEIGLVEEGSEEGKERGGGEGIGWRARKGALKKEEAQGSGKILRIVVAVEDTGLGILSEVQEKIFHPWMQADSSTSRRAGGTGIGLTISTRLVTLMGGSLGFVSSFGVGSTFFFDVLTYLPTSPVQASHSVSTHAQSSHPSPSRSPFPSSSFSLSLDPPQIESLRGLCVLCVDDHPCVRTLILAYHLQRLGIAVDFAPVKRFVSGGRFSRRGSSNSFANYAAEASYASKYEKDFVGDEELDFTEESNHSKSAIFVPRRIIRTTSDTSYLHQARTKYRQLAAMAGTQDQDGGSAQFYPSHSDLKSVGREEGRIVMSSDSPLPVVMSLRSRRTSSIQSDNALRHLATAHSSSGMPFLSLTDIDQNGQGFRSHSSTPLSSGGMSPFGLSYALVILESASDTWQLAAEGVREDHVLGELPLVLVVEKLGGEEEEAGRRLGVDALISKPLRRGAIASALLQATAIPEDDESERSPTPTTTAPSSVTKPPRGSFKLSGPDLTGLLSGKKILCVDDNMVNQRVACKMLARFGATTETASSGRIALSLLAPPHNFDLVFMDLQMPEMDGYETCERIREMEMEAGQSLSSVNGEREDTFSREEDDVRSSGMSRREEGDVGSCKARGGVQRRVPVVAMTADVLKGTKEKCLAAGMDGYITKPIDTTEIFNALQAIGFC